MTSELAPNSLTLDRQVLAKVRQSGTSFYAAMCLLPKARRNAMFAIYAFCRDVDDIADEPAPLPDKLHRLDAWRSDIARIYSGEPVANPIASSLIPFIQAFGMSKQDFFDVIDGMAMDAAANIISPTWADLDLYCDKVASAVGRLSVRAFGAQGSEALDVAHHLGRALQLTNILRDLDEDAGRGRLYLPRESLVEHGIADVDPASVLVHPNLPMVCKDVAERALQHFASAELAMKVCSRASMRPARVMLAVYRDILRLMMRRGWSDRRQRPRLSKWRKLWLLCRHALV